MNKEQDQLLNINALVPEEILERIFRLLPPDDLKAAVQVCQWWKRLGEAQFLWAWVGLRLTERSLPVGPEILTCRRLQGIKSLTMINLVSSDELTLTMFGKETLKFGLDLSCIDVAHVEPGMLTSAVAQLKMDKGETHDKSLHLEEVLSTICGPHYSFWEKELYGAPRLKALNMQGTILSLVDSVLLAKTIVTLEELNIEETFLTPEQTADIFTFISGGSLLKKLNVGRNNLSTLAPDKVAKAIIKLEEVDVHDTQLTRTQVNQLIFAICSNRNSKLKKLNIRQNDLSTVEPTLLARTVANIQEVDINATSLNELQGKNIFYAIKGDFKLRKLNIGNNNLSSVEPRLMARTVNKLSSLEIYQADLTERQVGEILKHGLVNTSLQRLAIGKVNCEVDMYLVHNARSVYPDLDVPMMYI
jgi:hypothetical protein